MNNIYPHELSFGDLYVSPFLVVFILSFFATLFSVVVLNKLKLSRYFYLPQYVFLALMVIYGVMIDHYFIRF